MLKGRPIGLKARMSKEEMKNHLLKVYKEWKEEGYSEEEVKSAIESKCRPLLYGFYWHRFPEASKRLAEALKEIGFNVENIKHKKKGGNYIKKNIKKTVKRTGNYLSQF